MEDAPNVVTSNFSIKTHPIEVLFDSSVTHLFISTKLVDMLQLALTPKQSLLNIALPDGKVVNCQELFLDWPILI